MNSNLITSEEVEIIVEEKRLELIEDIVISVCNNTTGKSEILYDEGCQHEPPYKTLYSKRKLMNIIEKLI